MLCDGTLLSNTGGSQSAYLTKGLTSFGVHERSASSDRTPGFPNRGGLSFELLRNHRVKASIFGTHQTCKSGFKSFTSSSGTQDLMPQLATLFFK